MFAQRPLVLFGKWRGEPKGEILIDGLTGSSEYHAVFDLTENEPMAANSALPYLWARKKIARLSDYNFELNDAEKKAQITTLGLTYNLMTAHTSFVAVHDVVRNPGGDAKNVKQPLPLPKGVSNLAVGGGMTSVPEPELVVLVGLMVLMFSWIVMRKKGTKASQLS